MIIIRYSDSHIAGKVNYDAATDIMVVCASTFPKAYAWEFDANCHPIEVVYIRACITANEWLKVFDTPTMVEALKSSGFQEGGDQPVIYERNGELHYNIYKEDSHPNDRKSKYRRGQSKGRVVGLEEVGWKGYSFNKQINHHER